MKINLRRQIIRCTCSLLLLTGSLILLVPCPGYTEQVVIDAGGTV